MITRLRAYLDTPGRPQAKRPGLLRDTAGASLVIALVFFLICAVIGSVVITAATVNTKAAASYRTNQQDEYTMSSAVNLFGTQLQKDAIANWDHSTGQPTPVGTYSGTAFFKELFESYEDEIWAAHENGAPFIIDEPFKIEAPSEAPSMADVYAMVVIDRDLNITATLSLSSQMEAKSPFNQTVSIQSMPTYNNKGQLTKVTWKAPVITSQGTGPQTVGYAPSADGALRNAAGGVA